MWKRILTVVTMIVGLGAVVYHLLYSQYILQGVREHRITHLGLALLIVFLINLRDNKKHWPIKLSLISLTVFSFVYLWICYPRLELYGMLQANNLDLAVGIIVILLTIEATRVSFGLILPLVTVIALAYMYFGSHLPEGLFHAMSLKWDRIIEILTVGFMDTGTFGPILGVSATFIFLFMVFASLVQTSGATEFFNQVGNLIGRRVRASSAMAATITSGLLGSISGQAGPNVMITGSYTIPAMKKLGYMLSLRIIDPGSLKITYPAILPIIHPVI